MPSQLVSGLEKVLAGRLSPHKAALEVLRRRRTAANHRRERIAVKDLERAPAQLRPEYQQLSPADLLKHFRERTHPIFFRGMHDAEATAALHQKLFPAKAKQLLTAADLIVTKHNWPLLGFGGRDFGDAIEWRRDPLSGILWPLDYHADISLVKDDGSDVRVLWELNRLGHFISLGCAYATTKDPRYAKEVFVQLESWHAQNPLGLGPNWSCAMEVALRSMNLLGAFTMCRDSEELTEERLALFLKLLDQHARHILRNPEFSYLGNSNHYLSDLTGLLWIGITLPELAGARDWTQWALKELLREVDHQVLLDGADYEGSTGYHRYVLELCLYSFILCRENEIEIESKYRDKLWRMLDYVAGYLRPCGSAPLIGDTDGGQVLPVEQRAANDHAYLLAVGAVFMIEFGFKARGQGLAEELLWLLGEKGIRQYENLHGTKELIVSRAFPKAGTYVLRSEDLYLLFNLSTSNRVGRSSHRHNDALSIEVTASGRPFIVDPGTYVYTADLDERHRFRSTAYHSTIQIDDAEQNTTDPAQPFILGDEAKPKIVEWNVDGDWIVGEHTGYQRLPEPVKHRRSVKLFKEDRWWLVEDELFGKGEHLIATRFHFAPDLEVDAGEGSIVCGHDKNSGSGLVICALDLDGPPELQPQFTSNQYGEKNPSVSACWLIKMTVPGKLRWALVPVAAGEDVESRIESLVSKVESRKSEVKSQKSKVESRKSKSQRSEVTAALPPPLR